MNNSSAEKLTFWQLIEKTKIEIPIIQRDYAQGREDNSDIRNNFLDAIFNAFKDNNTLELDFIYGNQEGNCLQPLDGQQRLTTLFLLQWYIAVKENKLIESKEILKKFTYETRASSREFCNQLIEHGVDFNNLLPTDFETTEKSLNNAISKTIIDSSWFFLSWIKDPTISSMLTMLNAIHQKYENLINKYNIWEKLTIENRITFLHIPLKDFGLSDDLYIKMNARGKALTDFEKFKAKFEQFLEKKYKDLKKDFTDKIDGGWTDLFWDYKDSKTNLFDELFINFFRVVAINHYAYSKEIDNEFEINISLLRDKKQQISFEKYFELDCFDSEYVALISCVLDKLSQNRTDKIIKVFFTESNYFNEISIFNGVIENSLGYADMVKFYGYSQFLFNEEIINTDETNFIEWMRVVRNLVEGSKLTYYINATVFANSIKAINKLVMYRNDILTYFSNLNEDKLIGFLQIQINEEILKAKLILKNAEWRKAIITIENHGYFNGQIGFLLEFSGIDEYLKKNGHINWDNNENKEYFNIFLNYTEKIKTIFNSEGLNRFEDYIFERALLAKGDYLLKRGRNYSFLIDSERDISWKRLLRDNNENRKTVKLLLDSINLQTLQKELQNIIDNFSNSNDWRYYFIKYPEIIKSCGAHKLIRWNDDFDILLLGSSTTSGYHKEYFSYALYLKLENIVKNIVYNSEKSREVEKTFTIGEGEITISFVNAKYKLLVINSDEVQYFDTQEEVIEFLSKNNFLLD